MQLGRPFVRFCRTGTRGLQAVHCCWLSTKLVLYPQLALLTFDLVFGVRITLAIRHAGY